MPDTCVNIVIGGEAGQGLVTVGDFLAKALVRAGYEIVVTQDYLSRIRGGHNTYAIRVSHEAVHGPRESIDLLVALDAQTVLMHRADLTGRAMVLADDAIDRMGHPGLSIPIKTLCPKPIFENMAALGVLAQILCLDRKWFEDLIAETFHKKGDEIVSANLKVFSDALTWAGSQQAGFSCMPAPGRTEKRLFMHGNDAIALGALAAGANFCSYYPMTPSSSVASTLIEHAQRMGMLVEQAEDEIAAINMALGASYAGARVVVPTSGGGFALMVEGISLAGMTETPVVVVLAQRPGPATGLPTRTEQGDLNLVLYAGHGNFPRAIFAPGTPEQCFEMTYRAMDQAEKWQSPVFVLTDQYLADSYRAVTPFDLSALPPVSTPALTTDDPAGYERYAVTENGVSPRLVPGFGEHLVVLDSDEHTPDGHITEDLHVRVRMVDKRMRKGLGLKEDVLPPTFTGDDTPDLLLACWGSTYGPAVEAAQVLRTQGKKTAVLHFGQVYPLNPDQFLPLLASAGRTVMVEGNYSCQLAALIRQETGYVFGATVTRYDGLPVTARHILRQLEKAN